MAICGDIKAKNDRIIPAFEGCVPDTKGFAADTAIIEERIRQLEDENIGFQRNIDDARTAARNNGSNRNSSYILWYNGRISMNNYIISELQKVVDGMRAFNSECANIYDGIEQSLARLSSAVDEMSSANVWSPMTKRFFIPKAVSNWAVDVEYRKMVLRDFGKGIKIYNFKYIREIMLKNPNEVTAEQYAAMIIAFNEMNLKQKEQFIECAYIQGKKIYSHEARPGNDNTVSGLPGKYQFKLSGVYTRMVDIYAETISEEGLEFYFQRIPVEKRNLKYEEEVSRLIGNYTLLKSIDTFGKEIYVSEKSADFTYVGSGSDTIIPVNVTLTNGERNDDYIVEFNGSNYVPMDVHGKIDHDARSVINTYGMRDSGGIDSVLDNNGLNQAESFRIDIKQKQSERITGAIVDYITGKFIIPDELSDAVNVGSVFIDCMEIEEEGKRANETVDKIRTLLSDGDKYEAFSVHGSIGACNGEYILCSHVVDVERLDVSLEIYAYEKKKNAGFTSKDISNGIKSGNFKNEDAKKDYADWYSNERGDSKTEAEMIRRGKQ